MSLNYTVNHPDENARICSVDKWNSVAKPLNSLGLFEKTVSQIAAIQCTPNVDISKKGVLIFCADHGVVEEGVTQSDAEVTALVAESIVSGNANINLIAKGADVFCVDMGMKRDVPCLSYKQAYGSNNIAKGPAMTKLQAETAINGGIDAIGRLKQKGYRIVAVGEMGIGNTTPTSCIASVMLDIPPEKTVGRGAGLSDEGLVRKLSAVKRAISINRPDTADPIDVLSKVGGYDIAGLVGAYLGGMVHSIPIVIDGVISMAAALLAVRICPQAREYMIASHISNEPTGILLANALNLRPVLNAHMALGEGTGAALMFPLLDAVLNIYNGSHTFDSLGMEAYTPQ